MPGPSHTARPESLNQRHWVLAPSAWGRRLARSAGPNPWWIQRWIAVAAVLGLLVPCGALILDAIASRPASALVVLLCGLVLQLLTEAVVARRAEPGSLAWVGLAFTLLRCVQLAGLVAFDLGAASGVSRAAIAVSGVLWPVNAIILLRILTGWSTRPAAGGAR